MQSSQFFQLRYVLIFASALTGFATGCQHADYAERRWAEREQGMLNTLAAWEASERGRPAQLADTLRVAANRVRDDEQKLARDLNYLDESLGADFDRFEARQPIYRREIGRILRGQPETLETTAIDMFY